MDQIIFKNYTRDLLEKQIDFVNEISKDWPAMYYPTKDELHKLYTVDNFTADTRHYALENGEIVAFISSAVENKEGDIQFGSIHFPFIKSGYESLEESMMSKTIKVLKDKGVTKIYAYLRDDWDATDWVNKYNFEEVAFLQRDAEFLAEIVDTSTYQRSQHIQDFESKHDLSLIPKLASFYKKPESEIPAILEILRNEESYMGGIIAVDDDETLGYGRIFSFSRVESSCAIILINFNPNYPNVQREMFYDLLSTAKGKGYQRIFLTIPANENNTLGVFDPMGINLIPFRRYEINEI